MMNFEELQLFLISCLHPTNTRLSFLIHEYIDSCTRTCGGHTRPPLSKRETTVSVLMTRIPGRACVFGVRSRSRTKATKKASVHDLNCYQSRMVSVSGQQIQDWMSSTSQRDGTVSTIWINIQSKRRTSEFSLWSEAEENPVARVKEKTTGEALGQWLILL